MGDSMWKGDEKKKQKKKKSGISLKRIFGFGHLFPE